MRLETPPDAFVSMFGELTLFVGVDAIVLAGPGREPGAREVEADAVRIRALARVAADGRYRPLSGARTLARDWHCRPATLEALSAMLDVVYPLAECHIAAWAEGRLHIVSLDQVLGRQSGRYAVAAALSEPGRRAAASVLCARCVRVPVWEDAAVTASEPEETIIPCPEPCSVLVSLCREAALWEAERPRPAPVDPEVPFAAFDVPGNEIRERYLSRTGARS